MPRLAIIATHPIQYYAPWFAYIARHTDLELKVFYLWDFGVTEQKDRGFETSVKWDIPLLEGYEFEFVPNTSSKPGTSHFNGLTNPELRKRVLGWKPNAVLLMAYRYWSTLHFILTAPRGVSLFFRGDSHRLHQSTRTIQGVLRQGIIRSIFRKFDAVLPVGQANREYFRLHGVPEDRMFQCPHAVDNDRLIASRESAAEEARQWRESLNTPGDHRVILFAGKLQAVKRPLDLVRSFTQANIQRATLLIVGSGELEDTLRKEAGDDTRIVFAPFQNQSLMPRTLAAADVVVLPSASETWGLILNEAMCFEKPVIASDHVGASLDLIQHGKNGYVYPMGDLDALAECLGKCLHDDNALRALGKESGKIISNFSYKNATDGLQAAISNVAPKGKE
ncbi:MAG: glycosyltransferase family 4 protein [Candidatus Sumerlaeia bacterium]|nr:glycosyltransferase family 4 protein [Candidatus Sumerlaeia bacterium]